MKSRPLLSLSQVSKIYAMDGVEFRALSDVSFAINEGEYVAIMGPSGSGKSTLMHLIGCLDTPTEGAIIVDGVDVSKISQNDLARIRNRNIGFVFQQFHLLRKTPAIANVELPLFYAHVSTQKRQEKARAMLMQVGLGDKLRNFPSQLSGGQQQRVAIARALVTDPKIILADEPTGNLDSISGKEIMALFEKFHRAGKTIVLVTHDQHVAAHAKRIISIGDGKIISDTKKK